VSPLTGHANGRLHLKEKTKGRLGGEADVVFFPYFGMSYVERIEFFVCFAILFLYSELISRSHNGNFPLDIRLNLNKIFPIWNKPVDSELDCPKVGEITETCHTLFTVG
jgi:hypothetical protein